MRARSQEKGNEMTAVKVQTERKYTRHPGITSREGGGALRQTHRQKETVCERSWGVTERDIARETETDRGRERKISLKQSIFYFMSVHIEVILDKNKNKKTYNYYLY